MLRGATTFQILIQAILLALLSASTGVAPQDPTVHYLDVGQGDATLLVGPECTVLIDAGRHDRDDAVSLLQERDVGSIDILVNTHPHADHVGQFPEILAAFLVEEVWMSGESHTTQTFERALDAILSSEAGYREPRAGETYTCGDLVLEILNPAPGPPGRLRRSGIPLHRGCRARHRADDGRGRI